MPTIRSDDSHLRTLLSHARAGATVDRAFAQSLLRSDAETADGAPDPAETKVIRDVLASAKSITPAAREALEAYVKTVDAAPSSAVDHARGGVLSRWMGRSPKPRSNPADPGDRASHGRAAARALLSLSDAKELLASQLDPVLAETVRVDSRYHCGVVGLGKLFPELQRALDAMEAIDEPSTAMMAAQLATLSPPPPFDDIRSKLRHGATLDLRTTIDLMRAAHAEGKSPRDIRAAMKNAHATDDATAFVHGWLSSPSDHVADRYQDAYVARHRARDPLTAFYDILADVEPELAELGHTELLWSSRCPRATEAFDRLSEHLQRDELEDWWQRGREIVVSTLKGARPVAPAGRDTSGA